MMLSRTDLNRVSAFKSSLLKASKSLYHANEKEINEYFDFQENLLKGISDFKVRQKLSAEIEPLRVASIKKHKKYTWIIGKVATLTWTDGILDCKYQKEAQEYFDTLDKDIKSIPTEKSNIVKLLELSLQYREATIESLKNR